MQKDKSLQCEYELKLAQERLQTMCDQTDSWLWETDENHVFTYFSENIERLTGLKVNDLLGTSRLELAKENQSKNWQNHAKDLTKCHPFKDFRYVRQNPDGGSRNLIITGWPLHDEVGKFTGYRGSGWDETAVVASGRRQVEKEENLLAEIENQRSSLETVLENLSQSVMWFDKLGHIRLNNAQTPKLLGFDAQEYNQVHNLTQHLTLMAKRGDFGDVDIESEVKERQARLCSDTEDAMTYRIHLKQSDRYLDVDLRPLPDGSRILTHTDVTQEAKKDRELSEREAMLSTVIDNVNYGIVFMDENLKCEVVNSRFGQMWNMDAEFLAQKPIFADLINYNRHNGLYDVDGDDDETWDAYVQDRVDMVTSQKVVNLEIARADGRYFNFLSIELPGGKRMATYFDITEIKLMELALRDANNDLEQANELLEDRVEKRTNELRQTQNMLVKKERQALLGDLVASLCHELRNPLNALNTSLYLIRRNVEEEFPKLTRAFDRSERTIVRCTNILNDLYDYALVDELRKEETVLPPWLLDIVDTAEIPESFEVLLDIDNHLPVCDLDPDQLGGAIAKIINNAAQAIAENYDPTKGGQIQIYAGDCGDYIEIIISDNGSGMDDETFAKALEPLYSTRGFGVGLGLPIAEQIIKRHGGTIRLETMQGVGTSVSIWFPTPSQPILKVA